MTISQTNVVFLRWGEGGEGGRDTKPFMQVLNSFFSRNQASCNRKEKMTDIAKHLSENELNLPYEFANDIRLDPCSPNSISDTSTPLTTSM